MRLVRILLVLCLVGAGVPVAADDRVELIVAKGKEHRYYTLAEIEKLGMMQVTTRTLWPEEAGTYSGVLLRDLLMDAGLDMVEDIELYAMDGYMSAIPREDWLRWPVLLATRKDGKVIGVRDKGPLRIIYPVELDPELADQAFRTRWVWSVTAIRPLE